MLGSLDLQHKLNVLRSPRRDQVVDGTSILRMSLYRGDDSGAMLCLPRLAVDVKHDVMYEMPAPPSSPRVIFYRADLCEARALGRALVR